MKENQSITVNLQNKEGDLSKFYKKFEEMPFDLDGIHLHYDEENDVSITLSFADDKAYSKKEDYEKHKVFIENLVPKINKLDLVVQQYLKDKNEFEEIQLAYILVEDMDCIKFNYYCCDVASEFDTLFYIKNNEFILKNIGLNKNIPDNYKISF